MWFIMLVCLKVIKPYLLIVLPSLYIRLNVTFFVHQRTFCFHLIGDLIVQLLSLIHFIVFQDSI